MTGIAALQFHPDGFDTGGKRLMGRQAAGEALLRAWVQYSGADPLTCWTNTAAHGRLFAESVAGLGATVPAVRGGPDAIHPIAEAGALLLAGPDVGSAAWLRRRHTQNAWSVVGLTHTTASHAAMDAIGDLLVAPLQPWDALICTSRAVQDMAVEILRAQADYLSSRLGAQRFEAPELPIIPLGVHADDFAPDFLARAEWRDRLGIGADDIVVFQMGRLSFHAKAHPWPMYLALQDAATRARIKPHLVLCGWFANDGQEKVYREGARLLAPAVQLHIVDGRVPATRKSIWSVADIFSLLVDNIQETFGLAPVEAMAAGLPAVVTDWDGFKDTVEDGGQGFLIPTIQPGPGLGAALAGRYESELDSYDVYVGAACQSTAVDVRRAAEAFHALFTQPELRAKLGAAGQARVRERFEWRVVIDQYRALFAELAQRRTGDIQPRAPMKPGGWANPTRGDPFTVFRGYPTRVMDGDTRLALSGRWNRDALLTLVRLDGAVIAPAALPSAEQLAAAYDRLVTAPATVGELVKAVDIAERPRLARGLGWMLKMDILRIAE